MTERYAVYFSPSANSALEKFGQSVLCRTASSPRTTPASSSFSDQIRWLELTEKPAHYGFHATLKAPFELEDRQSPEDLLSAVADFAKAQSPLELTSLYPRSLDGFMALTLEYEIDALSQFAHSCVKCFEPFRKTLSDADIVRRKQQNLSSRQETLLLEYGYPYVADEFRFHLTLSGRLKESDADYETWVISEYERLVHQVPILDQIAIFTQADRQTPFVEVAKFYLTG
jgi:2'-5' RNA ligase